MRQSKQKRLIGFYDEITRIRLNSLLSKKGIRCVIHYDYEGPEGGVCYVYEEDYNKSIEILKNSEFEFADLNSEPQPIITYVKSQSKKIPLIGRMNFLSRIVTIVSLMIFISFSLLFLNYKTVKRNELINNQWCLLRIISSEGLQIDLPDKKPMMMIDGDCINKLLFRDNTFALSSLASGSWDYLNKNKIKFSDNSNTYDGVYEIEKQLKNEIILLKSEAYTIYIRKSIILGGNIKFNFENR